ncbi:peptidase M14 family protein, partial [Candidatus Bathyarchaeota archaeon]|nr:peptidase M14 family protein [Candidatus Bathyarchaeota archaeon]
MTDITSPEAFFGHKLGTDYKIARWGRIVDYFWRLQKESKRIKVVDMGPSTEGHPFLAVLVTSEQNMENLERIQEVNKQITNPDGLTEEDVKPLVDEGKAVVIQSMSLHATEIGGTQMAP